MRFAVVALCGTSEMVLYMLSAIHDFLIGDWKEKRISLNFANRQFCLSLIMSSYGALYMLSYLFICLSLCLPSYMSICQSVHTYVCAD